MAAATNPQLLEVRSHTVSLGYNYGGQIEKEECYPRLTATWRGQTVTVEMSADRYRHSNGWSEWRIYARSTDPGTTETARRALNEVCRPLVEKWLASDAYTESRKRAFAWMIRGQLREERYSTDQPAALLTRYGNELTDEDRTRFANALDHLGAFLALIG